MKTVDEMQKAANYEDGIRDKMASMQTALDAEDPDEIIKIAKGITSEDYESLSPAALTKISEMYAAANELKKNAHDVPGAPDGVAPMDHDAPTEEKPKKEEGSLPEGKTDPQIDLVGGAPVEQAPGTSPTEVDIPKEISDSEKSAFVLNSVKNAIDKANNVLIKAAAKKRAARVSGERRIKAAELTIEGLIEEHGEEKVAAFLDGAAQRGYEAAKAVIAGGANV